MPPLIFGSDEARAIHERDMRLARRERLIRLVVDLYGGDPLSALEDARESEWDLEHSPSRTVWFFGERVDSDDMTAIISALSAQAKSTRTSKQGE